MNFVVAIQPEARPVIEHFKLVKRNTSTPFPIFENHVHRLVISGIGPVHAAAATGFLLGQFNGIEPILNVGIAGHGKLPVGTAFLANRILQKHQQTVHFPPRILDSSIPTSVLQTIDHPEKNYPESIGYDMEAHAFCSIAYKSVTRELVQVLKVVSDNPSHPLEDFAPEQAIELISSQVSLIERIVKKMESLCNELTMDPFLLTLLSEIHSLHHFTVTENHQLERLIQRACCLGLKKSSIQSFAKSADSGKSILSFLSREIGKLGTFS